MSRLIHLAGRFLLLGPTCFLFSFGIMSSLTITDTIVSVPTTFFLLLLLLLLLLMSPYSRLHIRISLHNQY